MGSRCLLYIPCSWVLVLLVYTQCVDYRRTLVDKRNELDGHVIRTMSLFHKVRRGMLAYIDLLHSDPYPDNHCLYGILPQLLVYIVRYHRPTYPMGMRKSSFSTEVCPQRCKSVVASMD